MSGIDFGTYTRERLKHFAGDGYTVVIPLAATEQHGPHLPVWTDTVICERICRKAIGIATGAGAKLLMAPVLGIGLLFRARSVLELPRDGETQLAGFAHGCTSSERPGAGAWQGAGWPRAVPV